jgi:hypothetical protein
MPGRSLATIQGNPMCCFVSSDFSPVALGHRFAIQGGVTAFFNNTFLELLDFFGGYFLGRSTSCIGPPTGPLSFEYNRGMNDRASLGLVF